MLLSLFFFFFFFFNDTATTEIYTLSLHDALPILAPTTAMKTPSYPCNRGSSNYSPAPPTISTHYTRRPRSESTGRPWQRYSASESWSTPLMTRSAASPSSKPKYGAPGKPKTRLKDAWRQRASIAPWATSAPYPTWGGGTSGSSGRTLRRGSSIVNEDIDI